MRTSNKDRQRQLAWGAAIAGGALLGRAVLRFISRYDLRDKVVLVTGGSRGLGLVMSRELIEMGARVAVCARDERELSEARDELAMRASGGLSEVLVVQCDLAVKQQVDGMIEGIVRHFGRLDVIINNAGIIVVGPAEHMTIDDYVRVMEINFFSAVNTTLAALPVMRRQGGGRIVNISSIGGKVAAPHLLPYVASKFALTGFSQGLRAELAEDDIVVTTACPGLMRTGSPRNVDIKGRHQQEYAWFAMGDSIPVLSISARSAARRIISAMRHGDAEVTFPLTAWLTIKLAGLFPGLTAAAASWVNRALPAPGGIGARSLKGYESESDITRSALTILTQQAAAQNNELSSTTPRL